MVLALVIVITVRKEVWALGIVVRRLGFRGWPRIPIFILLSGTTVFYVSNFVLS
jgi:hypothetical protein